jgi:hypothetical protein
MVAYMYINTRYGIFKGAIPDGYIAWAGIEPEATGYRSLSPAADSEGTAA